MNNAIFLVYTLHKLQETDESWAHFCQKIQNILHILYLFPKTSSFENCSIMQCLVLLL